MYNENLSNIPFQNITVVEKHSMLQNLPSFKNFTIKCQYQEQIIDTQLYGSYNINNIGLRITLNTLA